MNPFRRLAVAIAFTFFAALPISSIASSSTDFLSHLIENVTQTGTGLVPQEPESETEDDDVPFIDPGNFHSQV